MERARRFSNVFQKNRRGFAWLLGVFLLLCLGISQPGIAGLTPGGVPPAPPHAPKVPAKPKVKNIKKVALPDLAVQSVTWKAAGMKDASKAWIFVKVKNIGKAPSKPTSLSAVHECNRKAVEKKSFRLWALAPGRTAEVKWLISRKAGGNLVAVSVHDSINPSNNKRELHFRYVPPPRVTLHASPKGSLLVSKKKRNDLVLGKGRQVRKVKAPELVIEKVSFQDERASKPDESWISVKVKNEGQGESPSRILAVAVTLPGGGRVKKNFKVPSLRPGQQVMVGGAVRMGQGINHVKVELISSLSRKVLSAVNKGGTVVTVSHYFNFKPSKSVRRAVGAKKVPLIKKQMVEKTPAGPTVDVTPHERNYVFSPPDLKIISMETRDNKHHVHITATVVNIGGDYLDSYEGHNVKIIAQLFVKGPFGEEPVQTRMYDKYLPPVTTEGGEVRFDFHYTAPICGWYEHTLRVKFSPSAGEERLMDNERKETFRVRCLPDLRVWISRPSDARVGGHKRWFRFFVKNIGDGISRDTTMQLHIDGDGNHTYEVPWFYPGERLAEFKRGIRWWKKGRKHYHIIVNPGRTFEELNWSNNEMEGSLYVHGIKTTFNTKSHIPALIEAYLRRHVPFRAGKPDKLIFRFYNPNDKVISGHYKFHIRIKHPRPSTKDERLTFSFDRLLPGEYVYKQVPVTFDYAGRASYVIQRFEVRGNGDLRAVPLKPNRARGSLTVLPQEDLHIVTPGQIESPPGVK